jgi:hypothetical protein
MFPAVIRNPAEALSVRFLFTLIVSGTGLFQFELLNSNRPVCLEEISMSFVRFYVRY